MPLPTLRALSSGPPWAVQIFTSSTVWSRETRRCLLGSCCAFSPTPPQALWEPSRNFPEILDSMPLSPKLPRLWSQSAICRVLTSWSQGWMSQTLPWTGGTAVFRGPGKMHLNGDLPAFPHIPPILRPLESENRQTNQSASQVTQW